MNQFLTHLLGINYRTTILGIGAIVAAVGRIAIAYRTRDFLAMANDGQLIAETIGGILLGLGLLVSKDAKVTGVGTKAKTVDSSGIVTNVEGDVVGQQPPTPPQ